MDWPSLLVGAVAGGAVSIVMQNLLFVPAERRLRARRHRNHYVKANQAWSQVEQLHPRLALVQAGWDRDDSFPEGSAVLRLEGSFQLTNQIATANRAAHSSEWTAAGYTNGTDQIGISSISTVRISDDPLSELDGRAHSLVLTVHQYSYFDFLATHMLRLRGTADERADLDAIVGSVRSDQPVPGFPTPCSVGLSLFCEGGTRLLTPRRSLSGGTGRWEGGKYFNAVGEGVALRDFTAANRRPGETTPDFVAKRGLREELGFVDDDMRTVRVRIHSFAWATDVLDFKFFGSAETSLSRSEVQDRWRNASDRSETSGLQLESWPVGSAMDCRKLLKAIRDNPADWSPEAVFCTLRSLIALRRISAAELSRAIGGV